MPKPRKKIKDLTPAELETRREYMRLAKARSRAARRVPEKDKRKNRNRQEYHKKYNREYYLKKKIEKYKLENVDYLYS